MQEAIDELSGNQEQIKKDLEFHIAEAHAHVADVQTVQAWDLEILSRVDKLAEAVMGPLIEDFDGHVERDGTQSVMVKLDQAALDRAEMRKEVAAVKAQVFNGLRFKLSNSDKALIGGIVALVTAVVQLF